MTHNLWANFQCTEWWCCKWKRSCLYYLPKLISTDIEWVIYNDLLLTSHLLSAMPHSLCDIAYVDTITKQSVWPWIICLKVWLAYKLYDSYKLYVKACSGLLGSPTQTVGRCPDDKFWLLNSISDSESSTVFEIKQAAA